MDRSENPSAAGDQSTRPDYVLGYSADELRRLERQAAFLRDLTEDVLRRAAIGPGMRVLRHRVRCRRRLAAGRRVGRPDRSGRRVDRSAEATATAARRAAAAGFSWARFETAGLDSFAPTETFDALIGRLILMYLPDPAAALARLSRHVRPDGIVAFQEMAMPMMRSVPESPLFEQCREWINRTFERGGFEIDMGPKLLATFVAAGLPLPQMIASGRVGGGLDSPVYAYAAGVIRSLLPSAEKLGVATATEVGIDTLAERLRAEAVARHSALIPPILVGAWTRVPEAG